MSEGEGLQALGGILAIIGVFLSIIVTAAILVSINAGTLLWVLYILEFVFIIGGAIFNAVGETL